MVRHFCPLKGRLLPQGVREETVGTKTLRSRHPSSCETSALVDRVKGWFQFSSCLHQRKFWIAFIGALSIVITLAVVLTVTRTNNAALENEASYLKAENLKAENTIQELTNLMARRYPLCKEEWRFYNDRFYFFSEHEENWTYAESFCASCGASLAVVDNKVELDYMMLRKGTEDRWIGLKKAPGLPWMWPDDRPEHNIPENLQGEDSGFAYLGDGIRSVHSLLGPRKFICTMDGQR